VNKKVIYLILAIFLVSASAFAYLAINKDDTGVLTPSTNNSSNSSSNNPNDSQQPFNSENYKEYSNNVIANTEGRKILFFHAPWCPQCRTIENDIKRDGVPDEITIIQVDYDSNQALRQKYEVRLQTTFVEVDDNGNKIDIFVAYNEPTFDSVKEHFL
jgi:thiol-disulfide isomerase/thioredoxin